MNTLCTKTIGLLFLVVVFCHSGWGQLLSAPTLNGPANGATGVSTTPTFSWSSVSGANRYWLTVATSAASLPTDPTAASCQPCINSGITVISTSTSHTANSQSGGYVQGTTRVLQPNTVYYWRVQGYNTNGTNGNFSTVQSFTTEATTTVPTVQTIAASSVTSTSAVINGTIANNGGSAIIDRRFDWGLSSGNLTQAVLSVSVSGNNFSNTLTGLSPGTTYYFRAWARNGSSTNVGYGAGWNIGSILSFTTPQAVGTPTVTISNPSNNQTIQNSQTSYSFTGTATAPGSTVAAVEWRLNSASSWNTASGTTSWSFTVPNLVVGQNVVDVRSRNNQGSYSSTATRTITREAAAGTPTVTITTPSSNTTVLNSQTSYNFIGSATAPGSTVAAVEWRLNSAGNWNTASGTTSWSFTVPNLVVGQNVVDVRSRNSQSNYSSTASRIITRETAGGEADSWRLPLDNTWTLSQDFNAHAPNLPNNDRYHLGQDVGRAAGTPVYAAAAGTVKHNAWKTGYGYVVVIEHRLPNNTYVCSVYGHLRAEGIAAIGTQVTKGDTIGYLTGIAADYGTGPHIHFGIRNGSFSTDLDTDGGWRYRGYGPASIVDQWYRASDFVAQQGSTQPSPSVNSVNGGVPVTAESGNPQQTISINGSNFVHKPTVFVTWTGGSKQLENSQVTFLNSMELQMHIRLGGVADNWTVRVTNPDGKSSSLFGFTVSTSGGGGSTDYPGATWIPAGSHHFTQASRTSADVTAIVIHTTEDASYGATISWFQSLDPLANTSAHYVVRRDGSVVQMVKEKDIAHHAGSWIWNQKSIGIEVERLANPSEIITNAQYEAVKNLVNSIRTRYNVPFIFPNATPVSSPMTVVSGIVGHGKAVQNGIDPVMWDWIYFQSIFSAGTQYTVTSSAGMGGTVNPSGSIPKNSGESQTFTATPNANYTVNQWLVDGGVVQSGGNSYTLANIQANKSVQVTFVLNLAVSLPTVTTTGVTDSTHNSATTGGNVTNTGGAAVNERGVVYATTPNPTTGNGTKIVSGSGTGIFVCNLNGLSTNTTYYVRAYAINSEGTAYGAELSFNTTSLSAPEIELIGNNITIASGNTTTSSDNHTNFGDVVVNGVSSETRTFTIRNTGTAVLNLTENPPVKLISGFSVFSVLTQPSVTSLSPGSSTSFSIIFKPEQVVDYGAMVTIANDDANENPYTFVISGSGIAASTSIIRLSGNMAFGDVTVGQTSTRTLIITNSGNTPFMVSSISYPSGFSGDWSGTIGANTTKNVAVTFSPSATGNYSGTLTVNADFTSGTNTRVLSGTGAAPLSRIVALSGNLAFGNVNVGQSITRSLTITNIGNTPLAVSSISYPPGFSGNWSGMIGAGNSQNVTVTFAPSAAMNYSGNITVSSDATNDANTIPVTGIGVAVATRSIALSGNLSFGNVTVGQIATRMLMITNNGNSPLMVNGIDYPNGFSGDWFGTIGAGNSQSVTVSFTPSAATNYNGYLLVYSNASDGATTYVVSGTGVSSNEPECTVTSRVFTGAYYFSLGEDFIFNLSMESFVYTGFCPYAYDFNNNDWWYVYEGNTDPEGFWIYSFNDLRWKFVFAGYVLEL